MSDDDSEEPTAEPLYPGRGPNREEMASDFLPGEDEWSAKTKMDLNDPHAVAVLRQFYRMFPEVDDLQPIIDEFSKEFLKSRTSIGGDSREEITGVLKAMYGKGDDGDGANLAGLVAADLDDD